MHEYPPGSDWHAQKATRRYHVINRVPFLQPEIRAFFYGKYGAKVMRADFWLCTHAALQAFLADSCVPFFPKSIPVFLRSFISYFPSMAGGQAGKSTGCCWQMPESSLTNHSAQPSYLLSHGLRQIPVRNGMQRTHLTASECHQSLLHFAETVSKKLQEKS